MTAAHPDAVAGLAGWRPQRKKLGTVLGSPSTSPIPSLRAKAGEGAGEAWEESVQDLEVCTEASHGSMARNSHLLLIHLMLLLTASHSQLPGIRGVAAGSDTGCTKTCDLFSQECLEGECVCKRRCARSTLPVCTNKGFEYQSRCHFFRDQCLCKSQSRQCQNRGVETDYIQMYSACRKHKSARALSAWPPPRLCSNYHNRLAVWLNYALSLKLSETMVSLDEFEADEYLNGLYTNELLVYAPLRDKEKRMAQKLVYYPMESFRFDARLLVVWFCILDTDVDGWLDEKELAQLSRVLLPYDGCIESFLTRCRRGSATVSVSAWQGGDCFQLPDGDVRPSCDL